MAAAQPLPESSTSAYEKPPGNTTPRNAPSSAARPASRSVMVTSCTSKPASSSTAAISRSPLVPSSRSTATRGLAPGARASSASGVGAGEYVSRHSGGARVARPAASCATHTGLAWRASSWKDVASHVSRSAAMGASSTRAPPTVTVTAPSGAPGAPTGAAGTSATANACSTAASAASSTSSSQPSSSANSGPSTPASPPAGGGGSSSRSPVLPANAISSAATSSPPSLMSCSASRPPAAGPAASSAWIALKPRTSSAGSSQSGTCAPLPTAPNTWPSAEQPMRARPPDRSTCTSVEPPDGALRSGVSVAPTSGHGAYSEMTSEPGALTISPSGARAAMDSESLPPSTATPVAAMKAPMAAHASYSAAPSCGSLAAHIQLAEHLASSSDVMRAAARLVMASATARRPMAAGDTRPLSGCSPMDDATPRASKCDSATTAQSASGMCSGPTHCCRATSPPTARSTLLVRKRLEPTDSSRSTRSSAPAASVPGGSSSGGKPSVARRLLVYVFCGMLPSTFSVSMHTGLLPSAASCSTMSPSPVTSPTYATHARSRAHSAEKSGMASGRMSSASDSWYSAPQISSTDRLASPTGMARTSMRPPAGDTISLSTLQLPPAPWSWMLTIGLASPSSQHARMTRFTFCSICASPRCTALKSSSTLLSPAAMDDAAEPPMPMRYAGPPSLTTTMPGAGAPLTTCSPSMQPMPAVNMMGLTYSRRSPLGSRSPSERVKPATTGSPNLLP